MLVSNVTCCLHHIQLQYPHVPSQLLSQSPEHHNGRVCVIACFPRGMAAQACTELAGTLILMETCICDLCIPPSVCWEGVQVEMLVTVERRYTSRV